MVTLATISAIVDAFGSESVSVQAELCLNLRHTSADCRLCVDACPTEAIGLEARQPSVDPDGCVNCGLCLHWCPTDVFTQASAVEANPAPTFPPLEGDAVALVCPQQSDPARTSALVSAVLRLERCLASLSEARLIQLSAGGRRALWLDDSPCSECPIGRAQAAIHTTVTLGNRLLRAFGRPESIHTHRRNPTELGDQPTARPVVESNQPVLSRRGLFGSLGELASRAAAVVIAESLPTPPPGGPPPIDERLPHRIPPTRGHLFGQLKPLGKPPGKTVETAGLPFADVAVDGESCSACGLCARFCPTGALGFVAEVKHFVLSFTPAICVDCGICALICPEDAVSFGELLAAAALVDTEPRRLAAGDLVACSGCSELMAVPPGGTDGVDGGPRCYVCRHSVGPRSGAQIK